MAQDEAWWERRICDVCHGKGMIRKLEKLRILVEAREDAQKALDLVEQVERVEEIGTLADHQIGLAISALDRRITHLERDPATQRQMAGEHALAELDRLERGKP